MLKTKSIIFSYKNAPELHFPDIALASGEDLLVLGNSGVGKTTFIQILAGLLQPNSGTVEINGQNIQKLSPPI